MRGIVHEVKGDLAMVKIQRKEACGECRACFSGMMKTEMDIEAKNLCDAEEGDWVELELQENAFFNAVIVMYGLPFIGFIVGIVLGYFGVPKLIPNISPVLPSLVLGVLGIVLAMLWIHSQNHRWESGKYRHWQQRLWRKMSQKCAAHKHEKKRCSIRCVPIRKHEENEIAERLRIQESFPQASFDLGCQGELTQ